MASYQEMPLGTLLKAWRSQRCLSQMKLAERAQVSARHLSFVETGRATPSREMVLRLASAMDVPMEIQNSFLVAAGYAPIHAARDLQSDATLGRIRAVLTRIVDKHEPYPAVVLQRNGDLLLSNRGMQHLLVFLGLPRVAAKDYRANLIVSMFDPNGLRSHVHNWPDAARAALRRLWRDAVALGGDPELLGLIERLSAMPDVPTDWRHVCRWDETVPCMSFALVRGADRLDWLSTITSFGSPQDMTVQGLVIESFFPADEATEKRWAEIVSSPSAAC